MSALPRTPERLRVVTARALTPVTPYDLPTVAGYALTNQLYGAGGLSANGLCWYWELGCPSRIQEWVTLTAGDARLQLALDGDAVGLEAASLDWRSYAGQTQLIAWAACHEPLLDLLRALFRRDWVPEGISDCDASSLPGCMQAGFCVYRNDGLRVASGIASFDASCIVDLVTQLQSATPRRHRALESVLGTLPVVIDHFSIDPAEVAAMTRGCIVRLDNRTLATATPRVTIPAGRTQLLADVTGVSARVIALSAHGTELDDGHSEGDPMKSQSQADTAGDEDTSPHDAPSNDATTVGWAESSKPNSSASVQIDALPVRLTFTAGRLVVPLRTLSDIGPGFVFELDKRLDDQAITVRANDTPIALGELVALGDLIGVRITRMLPKP